MLDAEGPHHLRRQGQAAPDPAALTYFRAEYPDDKAARILYAAHDITWDYSPERVLRLPRRAAPDQAVPPRTSTIAATSPGARCSSRSPSGPAPRVYAGESASPATTLRCYGPFRSLAPDRRGGADAERPARPARLRRDDADRLQRPGRPLRIQPRQAACMRHEFGFCSGPCAGFVAEREYRHEAGDRGRVSRGPHHPADRPGGDRDAGGRAARIVSSWRSAGGRSSSSSNGCWRLPAGRAPRWICSRSSIAIPAPSATTGSISSGRASCGRRSPIPRRRSRREAFRAVVAAELSEAGPGTGPLPLESVDEILLLMAWFRAHPDALRRTTPARRVGIGPLCPPPEDAFPAGTRGARHQTIFKTAG